MKQLYTIGHSTRTSADFISLLTENSIEAVADVRSYPQSRYNPQFNQTTISASLKAAGIFYVFLGKEFGARREEPECYVHGTVVYDRVAQTPAFKRGVERITSGLEKMTIALMCAEREPLSCHRTILVARRLIPHVSTINHIISAGVVEPHEVTERRLLSEYRSDGLDLFKSPEEMLASAYDRRGSEIAYSEENEA